MMMSRPAKGEFLQVNIDHITLADIRKLAVDSNASLITNVIFLYVGIDDGDESYRAAGFSEHFIKIRRWGMNERVSYIQFSRHNPCYNELQLFPR